MEHMSSNMHAPKVKEINSETPKSKEINPITTNMESRKPAGCSDRMLTQLVSYFFSRLGPCLQDVCNAQRGDCVDDLQHFGNTSY